MLKRPDIAVLALAAIFLSTGFWYSTSWSAIGLTLDATGFLLLWRFGLPSHVKPDGLTYTAWDEAVDPDEKATFLIAKWISDGAVALIILGAISQYIGTL